VFGGAQNAYIIRVFVVVVVCVCFDVGVSEGSEFALV
jgi:hypothetical protein